MWAPTVVLAAVDEAFVIAHGIAGCSWMLRVREVVGEIGRRDVPLESEGREE